MVSRRELLTGLGASSVLLAGCLGDDDLAANCGVRTTGDDDLEHLLRVKPLSGSEDVWMAILVTTAAVEDEAVDAVEIRNRDGDLERSVPLDTNRDMNDLDPADVGRMPNEGELYAFRIGSPPQHAVLNVSMVGPDGDGLESVRHRFNCYDNDGAVP